MFSSVIKAVESHCRGSENRLTLKQHTEFIDELTLLLYAESEVLVGATKAFLGEAVFESSEQGFEYVTPNLGKDGLMCLPVSVGSMYVRSSKGGREISLNLAVYRSFSGQNQEYQPSVDIELAIENLGAKKAFEFLYKNYHGQISRFLEQEQIHFVTSGCSVKTTKSTSKKLSTKLDEFFSDPESDDYFALSKPFSSEAGYSIAIRSFLTLSILYVACSAGVAGKRVQSLFEKNISRALLE
jgi:hypothetical protein